MEIINCHCPAFKRVFCCGLAGFIHGNRNMAVNMRYRHAVFSAAEIWPLPFMIDINKLQVF